jgi:hypothetical protein
MKMLRLGQAPPIPAIKQFDKDPKFQVLAGYPDNFAGFSVEVRDLPAGCYVSSIQYGGRDVPDSGAVFIPDATVEIAIGTDGGHIDGAATGSDNQPQANAVIALIPADGKRPPLSLQADDQGAFHFTAAAPGDYKLLAFDDVSREDLANPAFLQRYDSQASPVSVPAGGAATATLKVVITPQ